MFWPSTSGLITNDGLLLLLYGSHALTSDRMLINDGLARLHLSTAL